MRAFFFGALLICSARSLSQKPALQHELQTALGTLHKEIENLTAIEKNLRELSQKLERNRTEEAKERPKQDQFAAVFDGGSTGTRLNIYQFDSTGLTLKSHFFENVSPGIHKVESAEEVLKHLLRKGREFLKRCGHSPDYDFPVVFNGTAGLRLLESDKREKILSQVKEVLVREMKRKDVEVRVIDGKEEGFYAWAALVFVTQAKEKIGIIDLGGGSAQISFEIDKDARKTEDGVVKGKTKNVLSRSFLGMGLVAGLEYIRKGDAAGACLWSAGTFDLAKCKRHVKSTIEGIILQRTGEKETAPGISQISTIFVSSFISEILQMIKGQKQTKFQDIKNLVDVVCRKNRTEEEKDALEKAPPGNPSVISNRAEKRGPDCINVIYAAMFMESLGVGLFTPIKDAADIPTDISWSLGRALSLIE